MAMSGGFDGNMKNKDVACVWGAINKEYRGVTKNRGTPKWMVYNGKPY